LQGEFLFPDDEKGTKKSDARDLAGLRPDTPLLSRNEMVSLKLASLRQASPNPFVPASATRRASRAKEIQNLKAKTKSSKTKQAKLLRDEANQVVG